jgi:hypothetical protein
MFSPANDQAGNLGNQANISPTTNFRRHQLDNSAGKVRSHGDNSLITYERPYFAAATTRPKPSRDALRV